MRQMNTRKSNQAGFSLTEVAVALAVASFCLTSIVGLIPVGLQANQVATGQTFTSGIVSSVVSDLRGTPASTSTSLQYSIKISTNPYTTSTTPTTLFFGTDGSFSSTQQTTSAYMVVITFVSNGSSNTTDKTSVFANISIAWPIPPSASATTKTQNSYQTFVALDRS
jgi:uncharacterized protein (TIGR02598 family)